MNTGKILLVGAALLVASAGAGYAADTGSVGRVSIGPRAQWFDSEDGDSELSGGVQLRGFLSRALALEVSADVREDEFGETDVQTIPVLGSLLVYLFPDSPISIFALAGGGWYYTRIDPPVGDETTDDRFGAHAGGGLQIFLDDHWSLDGTYRRVWLEELETTDAALNDKEFDDAGDMITAGINYHF